MKVASYLHCIIDKININGFHAKILKSTDLTAFEHPRISYIKIHGLRLHSVNSVCSCL